MNDHYIRSTLFAFDTVAKKAYGKIVVLTTPADIGFVKAIDLLKVTAP